jgi:hypothetical protein
VEAACTPFYDIIRSLAKIFQYAVHYIFAIFKMVSNTRMKIEIFDRNLQVAFGEQSSFAPM